MRLEKLAKKLHMYMRGRTKRGRITFYDFYAQYVVIDFVGGKSYFETREQAIRFINAN